MVKGLILGLGFPFALSFGVRCFSVCKHLNGIPSTQEKMLCLFEMYDLVAICSVKAVKAYIKLQTLWT